MGSAPSESRAVIPSPGSRATAPLDTTSGDVPGEDFVADLFSVFPLNPVSFVPSAPTPRVPRFESKDQYSLSVATPRGPSASAVPAPRLESKADQLSHSVATTRTPPATQRVALALKCMARFNTAPPSGSVRLASLASKNHASAVGLGNSDCCERCRRFGHTKATCALRGTPPSPHLARPFAKLCSEALSPAAWTSWSTRHAALPLPQRLDKLREAITSVAQNMTKLPLEDSSLLPDSLSSRSAMWAAIGCSRTVLSWLTEGVKIRLAADPGRAQYRNHEPFDPGERDFLRREIAERLRDGSFIEIPAEAASVINPLGVVSKANGKYRLILDSRFVNAFVSHMMFRLETIDRAPDALRRGDHCIKIDLSSAYYHVAMHPSAWPWLAFAFEGTTYTSRCLPFGFSQAPYVFHKIMRQIVAFLRACGIRCVNYLDDWILAASTREEAAALSTFVVWLFRALGFTLNADKCVLEPTTKIEFLGYELDTVAWTLRVSSKRLSKFRGWLSFVRNQLTSRGTVKARWLACLTGQAISMTAALPIARVLTRAFYQCIETRNSWWDDLALSQDALADLSWWLTHASALPAHPLSPRPFDFVLETDASDTGWGAVLYSAGSSRDSCTTAYGALPTSVRGKSSTHRELFALEAALAFFEQDLQGCAILSRIDNSAAASHVLNGGGRSADCSSVTRRIARWCWRTSVDLSAEWLPREQNTWADRLSRQSGFEEWSLSRAAFTVLNHRLGPLAVDRFASAENARLPEYNSLEPSCKRGSAFSELWSPLVTSYAFPPFSLVGKCVRHAIRSRCRLVLIAPRWPSQSWYNAVTSAARTRLDIPLDDVLDMRGHQASRAVSVTAFELDFRSSQ